MKFVTTVGPKNLICKDILSQFMGTRSHSNVKYVKKDFHKIVAWKHICHQFMKEWKLLIAKYVAKAFLKRVKWHPLTNQVISFSVKKFKRIRDLLSRWFCCANNLTTSWPPAETRRGSSKDFERNSLKENCG